MKYKKGFTLIEMMLVIAIIIIMSTVLTTSIMGYIAQARGASNTVASQNNKYHSAYNDVVNLG